MRMRAVKVTRNAKLLRDGEGYYWLALETSVGSAMFNLSTVVTDPITGAAKDIDPHAMLEASIARSFYSTITSVSNVETTFHMIKAKFGQRLRSRTLTAQINEALCKVLCHNLCVVIQSFHELGIETNFTAA